MIKKVLVVMLTMMVVVAISVNAAEDPKSLKELTEKAETIIVGKVDKQTSEWDENHRMIYTTVTVDVKEYLKGEENARTQVIRVPGGKVGDVHLQVTGVPRFENGEEALLFLNSSPENGKEKVIAGWSKGKIKLDGKTEGVATVSKIKQMLGKSNSGIKMPERIQFHEPNLLINRAKKYKPSQGHIPNDESETEDVDYGWKCVWGDNFEHGFPGTDWVLARNGNPGVHNGYTWGLTDVNPYDGNYAVWCAQTNMFPDNPNLQAGTDNYPNNTQAWMIAGPFDLSDVYSAKLTFKIDQTVEPFRNVPPADNSYIGPLDRTGVGFSIDGIWFQITEQPEYQWIYHSTGGYIHYEINIENVIGPLWDKTQVWVCFIFMSDYQITDKGTWIDNVKIKKYVPQEMHPEVMSVVPLKQSAGTGKSIKILGNNFGDFNDGNTDTKVEFFGGFYWWGDSIWIPATAFSHWNNTKIICDVPPGASSGKLRLRRPQEGIAYHKFDVSFGYCGSKWYPGVGNALGVDYPIIPFKIKAPHAIAFADIISSAETWNVQGNAMVQLQFAGPSSKAHAAFDGENTVLFDYYTFPGSPSTTYLWTDGSGHILEADIVLNTMYAWCHDAASASSPASMVISNWATHEFGNLLGLTNLYGWNDREKTMFGFTCWDHIESYFLDEHAADLHPADIEGLKWIYSDAFDVAFSAYPNVGMSPLNVTFTNKTRSKYPIASYFWDFGNGQTSTQQNPTVTYTAAGDATFDVKLTVTDVNGNSKTLTLPGLIKLNQRLAAGINAEPTVGFGPLTVRFYNRTLGDAESFLWDFGDGTTSTERNPVHTYSEPGIYTVSLTSSAAGFSHTESVAGLIEVYEDMEHLGLTCLSLVQHSGETWRGEEWDNAIDQTTFHTIGTANVRGDHPWAIFTFDDGFARTIHKVRLMTDTGLEGKQDDWVKDFTMAVSMDGENFTDIATFRKTGGGWEDFSFDPVQALFVKLTCEAGAHRWQQIGEFEVYEKINLPDISGSFIVASESHVANGYDQAGVKIVLADANGNPVNGLPPSYFRLLATGTNNFYNVVSETNEPGVYKTTFSSLTPEDKAVSVRVGGVRLATSSQLAAAPVVVKFVAPELVKEKLLVHQGSETWRNEDWSKAVDDDPETQVAANKFDGCYGVYKLADPSSDRGIIKVRLLRGNGKGYPKQLVTEYRISTSIDGVNFVELFKKYTNAVDWEETLSLPVVANYIKIELLDSEDQYRAFAELEVYSTPLISASLDGLFGAGFKASEVIPTNYALRQNYPNPFNPETMIVFDLPEEAKVTLEVYNLMGQSVKTLVNDKKVAGRYQIMWDGSDEKGVAVASGVYFYQIKAVGKSNTFSKKMKMMLVR